MVFFPGSKPEMDKKPFIVFVVFIIYYFLYGTTLSRRSPDGKNIVRLQPSRFFDRTESVDRIQGRHLLYQSYPLTTSDTAKPAPWFSHFTLFFWPNNYAFLCSHYRGVFCNGYLAGKRTAAHFFLHFVVFGKSGHRIFRYRCRNHFWTPSLSAVHVFHTDMCKFDISY